MSSIRHHLTYANVMVTILAFIVLGSMSYAATGGNFILGQSNSASSTTSLTRTGANTGKGLQVTNTSTGGGATALGLNVASGHAPFTVNSGAKVTNLNADRVDGLDSTAFQRRVGASCAAGSAIRAISATGTATCQQVGLTPILNYAFVNPDNPRTFTLSQTQKVLVLFSASGFRRPGDGIGHIEYFIRIRDAAGNLNSGLAEVWTNETNSHKAVVPASYVEGWNSGNGLPAGQYTVSVVPGVGTTWDENDDFRVTVLGLPPGS
jgi:hypothetical protein